MPAMGEAGGHCAFRAGDIESPMGLTSNVLFFCTISKDGGFWRETASKVPCSYPIYHRTRGDGRPRTQPFNCLHVNLVRRPR